MKIIFIMHMIKKKLKTKLEKSNRLHIKPKIYKD